MYMAKRKLPRYVNSIQCPVDLDSLIMSSDCSPQFLEENLNVRDDIFWDAIGMSTYAGWLLNLDMFSQFSKEMRERIYQALASFSRLDRVYFHIKLENSPRMKMFHDELQQHEMGSQPDSNIVMFNPLTMLSNSMKDWDIKMLNGELDLRRFLLGKIQGFLKGGHRDDVDFSHSLFLPELLNPKFFKGLTEAEHIVILGNLDRYFRHVEKFNNTGLTRATYTPRHEVNPPQVLVKHILSGEFEYTHRVKMIAWKKLFEEIGRMYSKFTTKTGVFKILSVETMNAFFKDLKESKLDPKDLTFEHIGNWLTNAEGVFEAFELDCTLHNLDASDYFLPILCEKDFHKMADGLVNFQDDATKDRLFKQLSEMMLSYR